MKQPLNNALIIVVIVIAIAFRIPYLDSIPPGLNFDEGAEGIAALDVTAGDYKIWWFIGGGKEPLMAYLVQPLFWIFGPTRFALRLYTALMGVGTVLAVYFLSWEFGIRNQESESISNFILLLPIIAALGVATSFWHVAYSRIAFRALSNPMVATLAIGFLWKGLRTHRRRDFIWAGSFTGGLIYTYLAGRFVPVTIFLFFIVEYGIAYYLQRKSLLTQHWKNLTVMLIVAFLVFAPLGLFFLQHPHAFVDRAGAVSIFSPNVHHGNFWGLLGQTTLTTLGTFVSLTGDPNPLGNIPYKPYLPPYLAIFFVIGIIISIRNWHKPVYVFLLIWWSVMLLPGILAPEDAPHHLRLIGTIPATYLLVALGLCYSIIKIHNLFHLTVPPIMVLITLIFGLTSYHTYDDYFIYWTNEIDHYMSFDVYAEELAHHISNETESNNTTVIPMDLRASHEARHYTLDFLSYGLNFPTKQALLFPNIKNFQKNTLPYEYIIIDESTIAQSLTNSVHGKTKLNVIRWKQDKHHQADEKELFTFLLETGKAQRLDTKTYPVYDIETYQLPNKYTIFTLPQIENVIDITLDNMIQIQRATVIATTNAVAVGITYMPITQTTVNYKASIRLISQHGDVVVQKDRVLYHNWHQGTMYWTPHESVNEYYLLLLPPQIPYGMYTVHAVVYHPDTLAPLTLNGQVEIYLGQIQLRDTKDLSLTLSPR